MIEEDNMINILFVMIFTSFLYFINYRKIDKLLLVDIVISIIINIIMNKLCFYSFFSNKLLYTLLFTVLSCEIIFIFRNKIKPNNIINFLIISLVSVSLVELFIFNYRHFTSYNNTEITPKYSVDGVNSGYSGNKVYSVELNDINKEISNIYLDCGNANVKVKISDEGHSEYYELPDFFVLSKNKRSRYHEIYTLGKVNKLYLSFAFKDNSSDILAIKLNVKVPMQFSIIRVLLIAVLLLICYILRPHSKIYSYELFKSKDKIFLIVLLIASQIVLFNILIKSNADVSKYNANYINHKQYYELIDAFKDGHAYLNEKPDPRLNKLENPYDTSLRTSNNINFKWDHVYYKGKYYVYFGIGPLLLAYLPYNLITSSDLLNPTANLLFIIIATIGINWFLYEVCKKYFSKIKIVTFVLLDVFLVASMGILYIAKRPDFYSVPIMSSMAFTMLGFALVFSYLNKPKRIKLFLGALSLAFVALCRPQFLIASALLIPVVIDHFFNKQKKDRKDLIKDAIVIILPYLLIGAAVMYYNYIRFGSVFDFGVNYTLTTNDMTKRNWNLDNTLLGLFYYLFQLPYTNNVFPYLNERF